MDKNFKRQRHRGFSLIEILCVIGIIVIVTSFTIPSATKMLDSMKLTQASEGILGQLNLGQQHAVTKNRRVEARLYSISRTENDPEGYRALWLFESTDQNQNWIPLSKPYFLPPEVSIHTGTDRSSLLRLLPIGKPDPYQPVPGADSTYVAITFLPDGGTDLDPDEEWYLTLYNLKPNASRDPDKLKNYVTLSIQPQTGALRIFRP